jgi:uncharacterized membrane protein
VVRLEEELEQRITRAHRFSEAIGKFAGRPAFAIVQIIVVMLWIAANTRLIGPSAAFDPYPFPLLGMILALEAGARIPRWRTSRMSCRKIFRTKP